MVAILLRGEKHPPRDMLEGMAPDSKPEPRKENFHSPPESSRDPSTTTETYHCLAVPHPRGLPRPRAAPRARKWCHHRPMAATRA